MKFKHKYIHKFYAFALAAVFALTLAGCGGGGGSATTPEPPMTGPTDAERIADAQTAAMTAAGVAAAALAAVEANQSADLDSYIRASIANDNAQAALEAANAATTPAAAEAAQADAEAASADVQKYAGMVTTAHNAMEAARMELMALNDARAAAMEAYMDAKAALDAIAGQGDADSASYDMAVAALAAALMANDAAQAAETSADAEAAQADAEAALADAMKYAGMVTAAHMEATALSTAQGAAMQAYMDAKDALAAAAANRDSDPASYDAAQRALGVAEEANMAAQAATTSEAAEAAQADVEAASANAVKYAGMVNQAKADADAAAAAAKARAAANKIAGTKEAAILAESDPDAATAAANDVRPFDGGTAIADGTTTSDPAATTMYELTVKHDGTMSTVEVRDERNLRKGDPKFSSVARFGDGQMLVRDNSGTSREIIVLHTDIEADTPTAFSKVHTLDANDDPDTTVVDNKSLTVATGGTVTTGLSVGDIDLGIPAPGEDATSEKTFAEDNGETPAVNEGMHRGRFDGAMGTYLCVNTNGCVVTVDDEGKTTAVTGTWTFTPDAGATVDVADADYMYYGFWLDTTTKDGAIASYDTVQTFAGSPLAATSATLTSVTGQADYKGGAAGVYVHNTVNPDSTDDVKSSGRFTADVNLNVQFGGAPPNRVANSIRGSISNFVLEHNEPQNWFVDIRSQVSASFGLDQTNTRVRSDGNDGSITAQFHGTAADISDANDGSVLAPPPVIVGEFNATFDDGSAAGAFGARKQ